MSIEAGRLWERGQKVGVLSLLEDCPGPSWILSRNTSLGDASWKDMGTLCEHLGQMDSSILVPCDL